MSSQSNPLSGTLFEDGEAGRAKRQDLFHGISSARGGGFAGPRHRRRSPLEILGAVNNSIERADRNFFEAGRQVALNERAAIADSLEQPGQPDLAALVRSRPTPPEWRKG